MNLYLNSLDLDQIRRFGRIGIISGVTSNLTMAAKSTVPIKELVQKICIAFSGPISVQVAATNADGMLVDGRTLSALGKNVVVKLPCTWDGLETAAALKREGIPVNMTLCFSVSQALLAASIDADYVSVFSGRLMDEGKDGEGTLREVADALSKAGRRTRVIAASLNSVAHILAAARAGADIATTGPAVLEQMLHCGETQQGLDRFLADWSASTQSI